MENDANVEFCPTTTNYIVPYGTSSDDDFDPFQITDTESGWDDTDNTDSS